MRTKLFLTKVVPLIVLMSCENKADRDQLASDFGILFFEMRTATDTVNGFWSELNEETKAAQYLPKMKIDSGKAEELHAKYLSSLEILNRAINNISKIKEMDPDIKLVEETIIHLKNTKTIHESAMPAMIEVLRTGMENMSDEQREVFVQFRSQGLELQAESEELSKSAEEFMRKYNIKQEELDTNER